MIDERAYELLCCQLGLANEEKAGLRKQVNELIARLKAIEDQTKRTPRLWLIQSMSCPQQSKTIERKWNL